MGFNTRQNSIGLAGRKQSGASVQPNDQRSPEGVSDPYLKQYVIEIPLVASAAQQDTGFTMPANAVAADGFLRVKTASTGGVAQTINIGVFGGDADAILAAGDLSAVALLGTIQGADLSGENIGYTFAGADITGFEGELVLTVLASDD